MRLGLICSAGGSAAFAAVDLAIECGNIVAEDVLLLTDRDCGAEAEAASRNVKFRRINQPNREAFSKAAAEHLVDHRTDLVILYFSRLVSASLFEALPTANIHPALLPAFPGLGAVSAAYKHRVRFLGATLHAATAGLDEGPIIAQCMHPIRTSDKEETLHPLSFLQKVHLTLVAIDLWGAGHLRWDAAQQAFNLDDTNLIISPTASPALQSSALREAFERFQRKLATHELVS